MKFEIHLFGNSFPVYPGTQLHVYRLIWSTHVAPFKQGLLAHSFISIGRNIKLIWVNKIGMKFRMMSGSTDIAFTANSLNACEQMHYGQELWHVFQSWGYRPRSGINRQTDSKCSVLEIRNWATRWLLANHSTMRYTLELSKCSHHHSLRGESILIPALVYWSQ